MRNISSLVEFVHFTTKKEELDNSDVRNLSRPHSGRNFLNTQESEAKP